MSGGLTNPAEMASKQNDHKGMWFVGKVEDNNDPQKLKRVRISVPEFVTGSGDELPWAIPVTADFDTVKVPEVGTPIYVMFQQGDRHYPIYLGEHTAKSHMIPSLLQTNYPDRYGMVDSKGNSWYVDKSSGEVEFKHKSGTNVKISDSGDVTLHVVGSITSDATSWKHTGDLDIDGSVKVSLTVTADIDVKAAGISLVNHVHNGVDTGSGSTLPPI